MPREFKFNTLDDLKYWTANVFRCIQVFLMIGLLFASAQCVSGCGGTMYIVQKSVSRHPKDNGYCYFCSNCKKDRRLRRGTIFEGSDKPFKFWIDMLWVFTEGEETGRASRYASYQRKQGGKIFSKFRKCCGAYLNANFHQLGGNDFIIEIDESAFSKLNKNHQGGKNKTRWVFGMIERSTGRCKFIYVQDRTRKTLIPIIEKYVKKGAQVNSDMWRAYWVLAEAGYIHRMVNHSDYFIDEESGVHTSTIEGVWKWAKAAIQKKGGCKDHQLQEKLDEFAFRKTYLGNSKTNLIFVANVIAKYHQSV
eukprot:50148_1